MFYQPLLAFWLLAMLPPQDPAGLKREDPDYQRFPGRWTVVSMSTEGKERNDKPKALRFLKQAVLPADQGFLGYLVEVELDDDVKTSWAFAIDSTGTRAQLYLFQFDRKANLLGPFVQIGVPTLLKGTYTFSQDRLTLYLAEEGEDLPPKLDPKGKGITVLELQRQRDDRVAPLPDVVIELAAARDQQRLFTGRTKGMLQLWSLEQGKELARWQGHAARLVSLAASRDLKRGLTTDVEGRICWWDLEQRKLLRTWQAPVDEFPALATLSSDGQTAYVTQMHELVEMEAATGAVRRRFKVARPPATCLAVSTDGAWVAFGDGAGSVRRFSLRGQGPPDGEVIYSFPKGGIYHRLRFADTGETIYAVGLERAESEMPLFAKLVYGPLTFGIIWPFFTHLFERSFTHPVALRIQALPKGVQKAALPYDALSGEALSGDSYDLSSNGRGLVLYGKRALWFLREPFQEAMNTHDAQEGGPRLQLLAQEGDVLARTWLVGERVIASRLDGRLEWFDLRTAPRPRPVDLPKKREQRINARAQDLAIAADGKVLLASGLTRGGGLWNAQGRFLGVCDPASNRLVLRYQLAPGGDVIYAIYDQDDYDPKLRRRQTHRGLLQWPLPRAPHAQPQRPSKRSPPLQDFHHTAVYTVLPDGKRLFGLKASDEGRHDGLAVWDLNTGRMQQRLGDGTLQVGAVTVSPDGKLGLAQEEGSSTVHVWDLATSRRLHVLRAPAGHVAIAGMGWTSQGALVTCTSYQVQATGSAPGHIQVWNVTTGELLKSIAASYQQHFALASRADRVVTTSSEGLRVWDLRTGALQATLLEPQLRGPVAVAPDGTLAAVAFGGQLWLITLDQPLPPSRLLAPLPAEAIGELGLKALFKGATTRQ